MFSKAVVQTCAVCKNTDSGVCMTIILCKITSKKNLIATDFNRPFTDFWGVNVDSI